MSSEKSNLFARVKNSVEKVSLGKDIGLINPKANNSITLKDNGDINICIDEYTQVKLDKNMSYASYKSMSSERSAVMDSVNFLDLIVNKHKFNNQLVELTDFRDTSIGTMGDLLMNGTVLVKTWEPTLEKWVLIRRPISTAMFSHRLNVPNAPKELDLNLNVMEDIKKYYISDVADKDKEEVDKEKDK